MSSEANDVFRIDSMTLKNFRCFEERTIEFAPQFNVLIGDNQTGKTTVVDALAFALSSMLWVFYRGRGAQDEQVAFRTNDVRLETVPTEGFPRLDPQYPVEVRCDGLAAGKPAPWGRAVPESGRVENPFLGKPFSAKLLALRDEPIWPLIARYSASRYRGEPTATAGDAMPNVPREYGYAQCLDAEPSEALFLQWIKRVQFMVDQEKRAMPILDAAKRAVSQCVEECESMKYRAVEDRLSIDLPKGKVLPFDTLSAGIRGMVAMVVDMVWRCMQLNQDLGADAVRQTPGVVLIDEIDLHLHPKWQRRVVDDLKRAFPKVQFIATTHSPFIIQSLDADELYDLEAEDGEPASRYADRPVSEIAELVQGVDDPDLAPRKKDMLEAAKRYHELLDRGDGASPEEKAQLKAELDRLTLPFSDNVAYHASLAYLESKREAAGLGDEE